MIIAIYWLFAFYAVWTLTRKHGSFPLRGYRVDSSNLKKWQLYAENYIDWREYIRTNGLSHHTQDFDILFDDKEITHD